MLAAKGPAPGTVGFAPQGEGELKVKQGASIRGLALLGLAGLVIAGIWIYLLFFVIPPVFNGAPTP
jgi:hypothetical protein